jgi:hypothetical protein
VLGRNADLLAVIRNIHASNRRDRKKARCRVFVNGDEVTARSYYADDRLGIVRLYRVNESGQFYLNERREVAREERRGQVRLERTAR